MLLSPHVEVAGVHTPCDELEVCRRELMRLERPVGSNPPPLDPPYMSTDTEHIATRLELKYEVGEHERACKMDEEKRQIQGAREEFVYSMLRQRSNLEETEVDERATLHQTAESSVRVVLLHEKWNAVKAKRDAEVARWRAQEEELRKLDADFYKNDKERVEKILARDKAAQRLAQDEELRRLASHRNKIILDEDLLVREPYRVSAYDFPSTRQMYCL